MAANLFNVHEDVRFRPSTCFVVCFLPSLGPESKWDERGGNSKSVRNTELMMESNDCLFEGWNEQTCTTHIERGQTEKLRLTLLKQATSMISQKVTKCWVTLGTVTIAFAQPVTGYHLHEFGQPNKANPYSERWWRTTGGCCKI